MDDTAADCTPDPVAGLAARVFGVPYLMPLQRMVMGSILDACAPERGDAMRQIVLFPTGYGKSLCFQLPALLAPKPTLVIYPLLALMADQKRRLDQSGIASALFRGGMSPSERQDQERAVRNGARLVIANPEILRGGRLVAFLKEVGVSHIAVDEAHCVSEWGNTFRPSYLELGGIVEALAPPAVSAFTATASPEVTGTIARILFPGKNHDLVTANPDRPNIHFSLLRSLCPEHSLIRLVRQLDKPLIVFCASREGVQITAETLAERLGYDTRFYHAGLDKPEKKAIEDWFMASPGGVLASTCAYGMGVDKKNIRSVVHYGPAASVEAYLQEAGRAGRDGEPARAVLIMGASRRGESPGAGEESQDGNAAPDGDAAVRFARARRDAFLAYTESAGCRRETLLRMMGAEATPACSGCDVCDGAESGRSVAEGFTEIERFFAANGHRFDRMQAIRLIAGAHAGPMRRGDEPPVCAHSGILAGWTHKELRLALSSAVETGLLEEGRRFPWKGRLWLAKPTAQRNSRLGRLRLKVGGRGATMYGN